MPLEAISSGIPARLALPGFDWWSGRSGAAGVRTALGLGAAPQRVASRGSSRRAKNEFVEHAHRHMDSGVDGETSKDQPYAAVHPGIVEIRNGSRGQVATDAGIVRLQASVIPFGDDQALERVDTRDCVVPVPRKSNGDPGAEAPERSRRLT